MLALSSVWADQGSVINVTVEIDSTAPKTQAAYDDLWHNADLTIDLTATDGQSGMKDIYYRINNGPAFSVGIAGQPVIATEGGNNTLEYWGVDKADNEELPHNVLAAIKLDKTAPEVKITSPVEEACYDSGPITVSGTVSDSPSGVKDLEVTTGTNIYNAAIQPDGSFSVSGVDITGGPNSIEAIAQDESGNEGRDGVTVFLGWLLHLKVPYYTKTQDHYSGAASCQIILNYIRDGLTDPLTQDGIYNYGHLYNYTENTTLQEMDPCAVEYALGHFDPYDISDPTGHGDIYSAYNFDVDVFENTDFTKYLRDIIHWMAYPVTVGKWWLGGPLTKWPNTPVTAPAYGTYDHWIVVNGASTSQNPIPEPRTNPDYTPDFTVYGLWLTDPASGGIGKDVYVTAQTVQTTYLLPLVTSDRHNGKYLHVAEPPEVPSRAEVTIAEPNVNDQTRKIIEIAREINTAAPAGLSAFEERVESAKKHIYDAALVVNIKNDPKADNADPACQGADLLNSVFNAGQAHVGLDWKKIIDAAALMDENFRNAFDGSQARGFVKVRRADKENEFYYLIPFDKYVNGQFLTYAAIIINAEDGSFKEASWVGEPTRFIQVTKDRATGLVISANPALQNADIKTELIWEPGGISQSPFYPYWKIASGNKVCFVTQKGEVIEKDGQI